MARLMRTAAYYRHWAEEMRSCADGYHPGPKELMEKIALEYDDYAEQREREAAWSEAMARLERH